MWTVNWAKHLVSQSVKMSVSDNVSWRVSQLSNESSYPIPLQVQPLAVNVCVNKSVSYSLCDLPIFVSNLCCV